MKKMLMILVAAIATAFCFAEPEKLFNEAKIVKDTGNKPFTTSKAIDVVPLMKNGWNLGNTLDATGGAKGLNSEMSWGQPKTTKAMIDALAAAFIVPRDVEDGRLILSVHAYSPYNFAMGTPGDIKFTPGHKTELRNLFSRLNTKFVSRGIPVIIGEYGATNKDNLQDRVDWFEFFLSESKKYGMICCLWDNGNPNPSTKESERYGYYNRRNQTWYFPEIQDKIIEVTK